MKMRQLLAGLVRFSGLPFLLREVVCRRRVAILVYHNPIPEVFEAHLAYLTSRFNIIQLEQLVEAIEKGDWQGIPPKSLVITFDDGHRRNWALLDIVQKYRVPVTIYVCAGIMNSQRHYWFLDSADKAQQLKRLPNQHRLKQLAFTYDYTLEKEFAERQALSKAEMLEMKRHRVDFQSHTISHPILTTCTDDECWLEIAGAKKILENLLEVPVAHFAYPNGDYGEREMAYVQKAGYRSARTVDMGWNGPNANIYALKSMSISDDAALNEMVAQLCGIFPYFRYLRRGSWTGRHITVQIPRETR